MNVFRRYVLHRLLRRRPPKQLSSDSPVYGKRNDIYVRASTEAHENALLLAVSARTGKVSYVWWPTDNEHANSTEAECNFEQVKWKSISVNQEYHAWRVNYPSPYQAFVHDLLFLPQIRYFLHRVRDQFYTPLTPDKRMEILEQVIKRHGADKEVRFEDLMVELYGPSIRLSLDQHAHFQRLKFILKSLEVTGDVKIRPERDGTGRDWVEWELHGDVIPEPKAIATLAAFFDSQRKHRDTIRLSIMQFILGLGMLAVAVATLVVRLGDGLP